MNKRSRNRNGNIFTFREFTNGETVKSISIEAGHGVTKFLNATIIDCQQKSLSGKFKLVFSTQTFIRENFEKNNFLSQQRWYWKSEFYSHDNMYVISDKSPPPHKAAQIIYSVSYKSIRQVIFGSKVLPACITIQRVFRGYQTRMMMDSQRVIKSAWRKHKYAKHKSARTIQKIFRGHYSRTNLVHKVYHPYNYNGKWEKLPGVCNIQ